MVQDIEKNLNLAMGKIMLEANICPYQKIIFYQSKEQSVWNNNDSF